MAIEEIEDEYFNRLINDINKRIDYLVSEAIKPETVTHRLKQVQKQNVYLRREIRKIQMYVSRALREVKNDDCRD
jgi:hypothetical protein